MKQVLSLLVAFVFMQVQSQAYAPAYSGNSAAVSGTYAGVLVPSLAGNSLGIFVIGVPAAGLATGAFAMFATDGAFYGTIVGIIDPDKLKLTALAQAQENRTQVDTTTSPPTTYLVPVALAAGALIATLTPEGKKKGGSSTGYRLTGSGTLSTQDFVRNGFGLGETLVPGPEITVTVDGFQQSTTVTGTVDISGLLNGTGSGG